MSQDDDNSFERALITAMDAFNGGDLPRALDLCQAVVAQEPTRSEGYFLLGCASFILGRPGSALSLFRKAHDMAPDIKEYAEVLGTTLVRVGHLAEGLYYAKLATALPAHRYFPNVAPRAFRALAEAIAAPQLSSEYIEGLRAENLRNFEHAIIRAREELQINPGHSDAQRLLARSLVVTGRHHQAVAAAAAVMHMGRPSVADYRVMAEALWGSGRPERAVASIEQMLEDFPDEIDAWTTACALLPYCRPDEWAADQGEAAKRLAELVADTERFQHEEGVPEGRPIRIGYLADVFHEGAAGEALETLIRNHDRTRFHVYCYQRGVAKNAITHRLSTIAHDWREVFDIDDETLADIIYGDGIDVLVDLCGCGPEQRAPLLARHPARVQVGWLGRPEVAGLPWYDAVLADGATAASDRSLAATGQRVEVLSTLAAFTAPPAFEVDDAPCRVNRHITFGAVMSIGRLSPRTVATWSRILAAVPGSRVLLGGVGRVAREAMRDAVDLFGQFGVADRVAFQDGIDADDTDALAFEMGFLKAVDVVLDTFPVSCGFSALRGLWAGVPMVTLAGQGRAALAGASILKAVGKAEWVADSREAYVDIAVALSADFDGLAAVRAGLRDQIARSALLNEAAFARDVEAVYVKLLGQGNRDE